MTFLSIELSYLTRYSLVLDVQYAGAAIRRVNFSFPRRNYRNSLLLRTRHFISSDHARLISLSLSFSLRLISPPLQKLQTSYLSVLALGVLVIIAFINHSLGEVSGRFDPSHEVNYFVELARFRMIVKSKRGW